MDYSKIKKELNRHLRLFQKQIKTSDGGYDNGIYLAKGRILEIKQMLRWIKDESVEQLDHNQLNKTPTG